MNEVILRALHRLAHQSAVGDVILIFLADYLGWVMAVSFLIYSLWHWQRTNIWREGLWVGTVSLVAWVVSQLIKSAYLSPRPFVELADLTPLIRFGGQESFPSGHALVSFAFALAVYGSNRRLGNLYLIGAVLVSLARVAVGIHWPSDILGGFVLALFLIIVLNLMRRWAQVGGASA